MEQVITSLVADNDRLKAHIEQLARLYVSEATSVNRSLRPMTYDERQASRQRELANRRET